MTNRKACLAAAALCALLFLSTFTGSAQSASCCLNYIRHRIHCKRLLDYSVQTINQACDINAIVLHIRGRFLCTDPSSKWTLMAMKCINDRKRRLQAAFKELKNQQSS